MAAPGSLGGPAGDPLGPPAWFPDALCPSAFPDVLAGPSNGPDHPDCLAGTGGLVFGDVLSAPLHGPAPVASPGPVIPDVAADPAEPLTVPSTRVTHTPRGRHRVGSDLPGGSRRSVRGRPDRVELPTWLPDRLPATRRRPGR